MNAPFRTDVIAGAATYDLVDAEDVAAELGDIAGINRLIAEASAVASRYCRRVFPAETVTDWFRLPAPVSSLVLARYPVIEIMSIGLDGSEDPILSSEDGHELSPEDGIVYRLSAGQRVAWRGLVSITYRGGFATIPPDLRGAVMKIVAKNAAARGRDPLLRKVDIPGVASREWWVGSAGENDAIPPDALDALGNFADWRVA